MAKKKAGTSTSNGVPATATPSHLTIQVPIAMIDGSWIHNYSRASEPFDLKAMLEEEDFKDTMNDIAKNGLYNPLLVRPIEGEYEGRKTKYRVVAGFRRFYMLKTLATKDGKLDGGRMVPVIVEEMDDASAFAKNVKENVLRKSVTKSNMAHAILAYQKMFSKNGQEITSSETAKHFGLSASLVRALNMVQENVHPDILNAWATRDENRDFATYKATMYSRMTMYAAIKDDKDRMGTPDAQKRQLGMFNLERQKVRLMADGSLSEQQADEQARKLLSENGGLPALPAAQPKCEAKHPKTGKRCTLDLNHEGNHEYTPVTSVPMDVVKGLREQTMASMAKMPAEDAVLAEAVVQACNVLMGKASKIKVGKVTVYEPAKGDVAAEA